jgi:hypothetical protein
LKPVNFPEPHDKIAKEVSNSKFEKLGRVSQGKGVK